MKSLHIGPMFRALARKRARSVLTLAMTALTFAVVVNCLMVVSAQQEELLRSSGVDDAHLVYVEVSNFDPDVTEKPQAIDRAKADLAILRGVPGVVAAMSTRFKPWRGGGSSSTATRLGDKGGQPVMTQVYQGGPSLYRTLGIDAYEGGALPAAEMEDERLGRSVDHPASVVVSRKFAEELFGPDEDPLGKLFTLADVYTLRIVGLIETFFNPYPWNIEEKVTFFPAYSAEVDRSTFLVRVDEQRLSALSDLESALLAASQERGVKLSTIPEQRLRLQATERMTASVLSVVIGLMVFVTAVSIIGLTTASVASRRREIGTRRALGATQGAVLAHFLAENALLTAGGLVIGVAAAYVLNVTLVSSMGVPKLTVAWVLAPAGLVALVNVLAAWPPAWRASQVPPAIATKGL